MMILYRGFGIHFEHGRHFVYSGSKFIGSTGPKYAEAMALVDAQHTTPLDAKFERARHWLETRNENVTKALAKVMNSVPPWSHNLPRYGGKLTDQIAQLRRYQK